MNYEACSGAIALQKYFVTLGINAWENFCIECDGDVSSQSSNQITSESSNDHRGEADVNLPTPITRSNSFYVNMAEMYIQYVENRLLSHLVGYLQSCTPLVRIIQDVGEMKVTKDSEFNARRIPIVCFLHANISSLKIVEHCRVNGVVCRACKFLSTDRLWNEMGIEKNTEVVRFSLAHYNTLEEIDRSIQILELLDGWN